MGAEVCKDSVSMETREARFIQAMSMLAEKHGCKIVFVDYEARIINFEGPEENQVACAIEMTEYEDLM